MTARDTAAMLDPRLPRVPDDWTVWAFTDPHGVTSGLVAALRRPALIDAAGHWSAPPRTALVGCGDYIDRGGDVGGLVALLRAARPGVRRPPAARSCSLAATMRPCP